MSLLIGSGKGVDVPLATSAELKTTHLARDNFPGFAFCTDVAIADYVKSTGTQWKKWDGTVISTDPGTVQPATGIRRIVTSGERYMNRPTRPSDLNGGAALAGVETELVSRAFRRIAAGGANGITLRVANDYLWSGGIEGSANTLTIKKTFIEFPGVGIKQLLWDGTDGVVLQTKDFKHSVMILRPADLGLETFAPGTRFAVQAHAAVPAGGFYPTVETWSGDSFQCVAFDPTKNSCTSLGTEGELKFANTQTVSIYQLFTPLVTGYYESGDPLIVGTGGDSIEAGVGDQGPEGRGKGYTERATMGTDWTTAYAAINMTRPQGSGFNWANHPSLLDLAKLYNCHMDGILTNNFDDTANMPDSSLNYTLSLVTDSYAAIKAAAVTGPGVRGMTIVRLKLSPRTKVPTGNTLADQIVYGDKWAPGGNVEQFHAKIRVHPLVDYFYKYDQFCRYTTDESSPNAVFWKNGKASADDGTHQSYAVTGPTSVDLNAFLGTIAALPIEPIVPA
jgi:hypothetical protein